MGLRNIKLVTFDATNTLLKFKVPPWEHYAAVAHEYGFKGNGSDLKDPLLKSYKAMWNKFPNFGKNEITWDGWWRQVVKLTFDGKIPAQTDVDKIANRLIDEFKTSKCWCQEENSEKLISLLRNNGVSTLGVISNFDPRLNDILQNLSIDKNFDFILTSYEIGYSKPDERIFKQALQKCDKPLKPSECLHIGDDLEKDYQGARAAGWHALLVKKAKTDELPNKSHVFHNLDELCEAIAQDKLKISK